VIDEDERTRTFININGQTVKILKNDPGNMPMYLDWPVKDRESWKEFKKRLDPNTPERYPANWDDFVREINGLTEPVVLEVGGFFGYMREWVGSERVLYLFYDDPDLVEEIMDTMLELEMEIIKRVAKDVQFEMAAYWEDMAYNVGPLISPDMFRKFMMPRYKKLNELLHSCGIDIIYVDSDGNLDQLIPLWLECGCNFIWPLEVAAGNDAVALRKRYGTDLIMGGAIDKRALVKGKEATKEEVMSKVPFLLEKGGYFPSVDHLVPPDVPFEIYCYYINLLREIAGLEKLQL
jgi:uroporphyrinogen decarboxylase